jgi:hypothetical protein
MEKPISFRLSIFSKLDGFVKSPSGALHSSVFARLFPALAKELFSKPSFG